MRLRRLALPTLSTTLLLTACQGWFGQPKTSDKVPPPQAESADHSSDTDPTPVSTVSTGGKPAPAPAGSVMPGVLVVNNETLNVDDILEPIRPKLEQASRDMPRDDYYELLFEMIRRQLMGEVSERLIWHEAQRHLKDDEQKKRIDQAIDRLEQDRITTDFGGRESRYEKYLATAGKSRQDVRERLKRQIICEQYMRDRIQPRISVRKRDLQKYYDEHRSDFTDARSVELWMIEFPVREFYKGHGPPTDAEKRGARDAARAAAQAALSKIRSGQSFDQVTRTDSLGLHKEDGGNWGMISAPLRGPYEPPSRIALGQNNGQVSDVVDTPMAFFIVKSEKVTGGTTRRFEEVQAEITNRLQIEQFNELKIKFMQQVLDRASVGDLEPFVKAIIARAPESRYSGAKPPDVSRTN